MTAGTQPQPLTSAQNSASAASADTVMTAAETVAQGPTANDIAALRGGKVACPRCGSNEPWGAGSWCPACGFYPSAASVKSSAAAPQEYTTTNCADQTELDEQPADDLMDAIPSWMWVMAGGILALIAINVFAGYCFHQYGGPRSLVGTLEFLLGGTVFAGAHLRASYIAIKTNSRLTAFDIISSPIPIWQTTIDRLPDSVRQLYCGVWGTLAAFLSLVFIGGISLTAALNDWEIVTQTKKKSNRMAAAVANAARAASKDDDASLEESLEAIDEEQQLVNLKDLPGETDLLVFGFQTSRPLTVDRILLAGWVEGSLQHVATIDAGQIPDRDLAMLSGQMGTHMTRNQRVPCRLSGIWVEPVIYCRIGFDRVAENGSYENPQFMRLAGVKKTDTESAPEPDDTTATADADMRSSME